MLPLLEIRIFTLSQEWEPNATELRTSDLNFSYSPSTYIWVKITVKNKPAVLTYTLNANTCQPFY